MFDYDLIIVLATQPDPETWEFPQQIYDCLDRAKQLLDDGRAPLIASSGKLSISVENKGLKQPFRECDKQADYLISKGVAADKILLEGDSKDTISNLYYLKTKFLIPSHMKRLLFVVAEFRIDRLKFLCQRILGPDYTFDFEPINCPPGPTYNEPLTLKIQSEFLAPMKDGDHTWLADKFYTASIYQPDAYN